MISREEFRAARERLIAAEAARAGLSTSPAGMALEAEWHAAVEAAVKATGKRVRVKWRGDVLLNWGRVLPLLDGQKGRDALLAPFKARGDAMALPLDAEVDAATSAWNTAQADAPLPLAGGQRATLASAWASTYSTQTDASGYARRRAQIWKAQAEALGLHAEVAEQQRSVEKLHAWNVTVDVEDPVLDVELIKAHPLELREQVRLCWKLGSNPRVYMPCLPYDFEQKHNLNYFGGTRGA